MRKREQIGKSVGRATFAPEQAAIGGGQVFLSIGMDVAVGFSGFSKWYFLSSRRKWETPSIDSEISSA